MTPARDNRTAAAGPEHHASALRADQLSPFETLAQSISSVAPIAGPTLLIPLVFASAGNGTWLAYLLATVALCFVALAINQFAARSASPGSLYSYATAALRGPGGQLSAWGLLLAYIATAASVSGGFATYTQALLQGVLHYRVPLLPLAVFSLGAAILTAYFDIQISARLLLWFQAISMAVILVVVILTAKRAGFHLDTNQLLLKNVSVDGIRTGLVLAIFSFVGFESATALGGEAREPLRTIPRAVLLSAIISGAFFMFCAYVEVLGFSEAHQNLATTQAPLHVLAEQVGLPALNLVIDAGAVLSFLACGISCVTAGARVAMTMALKGLLPKSLAIVHPRHKTPARASTLVGALSLVCPVVFLWQGASGFDVDGWMGSLATGGFLTAYLLVAIAMPVYLSRAHRLTAKPILISLVATAAVLVAGAGVLYPWPPAPVSYLTALFILYLSGAWIWALLATRANAVTEPEA